MKIFDNFEDGVQLIDEDMRYVYLNKTILNDVGKTLEDHLGKKMEEVYPGIQSQPIYQKIQDCIKSHESQSFQNAFPLEGKMTYWDLKFERVPEGVLIFSRDITDVDEKQALEIPFEYIAEPCFLMDTETFKIERVNKAMTEIMQTSVDKLIGLTHLDISPEFQAHVEKSSEDFGFEVIAKAKEEGFCNFEWTHRRFNGEEFVVEVLIRVYYYQGDEYFLCSWRDLSQLKEQEKINQHQAKMVMIGQLAAGVGHEINNPLAIILGHLELLDIRLGKGKTIDHEFLDSVVDKLSIATDRIIQITDGLKTFARNDVEEIESFSPLEAIKESQYLLCELFKNDNVYLEVFALDGVEQLLIKTNKGKFQQILANLVSNARHAVQDSKVKNITITLAKRDDFIEILVKDTGHGIPKEQLDKIFEPFYTTKKVKEGTGLGLSFVYRYIQELGGSVSVNSVIEEGTTFKLRIPTSSN